LIPVYPLIQSNSQVTNIIPDQVTFGGVVRYSNKQLYERFMEFFENCLEEAI